MTPALPIPTARLREALAEAYEVGVDDSAAWKVGTFHREAVVNRLMLALENEHAHGEWDRAPWRREDA